MPAAIDKNTLDRLIAQGRAQGGLTTQDLHAALPIETMSTEDLALVVARLEDAGVDVDLHGSLLQPPAGARSAPTPWPEILSPPEQPGQPPLRPVQETPLQMNSEASATAPPAPERRRIRPVHWAVALAGMFALVLLVLIVLALGA